MVIRYLLKISVLILWMKMSKKRSSFSVVGNIIDKKADVKVENAFSNKYNII